MFTGIIKSICKVASCSLQGGILVYTLDFPKKFVIGLERGASVAVDGICQTVVDISSSLVTFEAIPETLNRTTLSSLEINKPVHIERAARFGEEIGGHLLSGHVIGTSKILEFESRNGTTKLLLQGNANWMPYLFPKGFIAIDGASLTLVEVDKSAAVFSIHLIPQTLRSTHFGAKRVGDLVNIEIDAHTQAIVDTTLHFLKNASY